MLKVVGMRVVVREPDTVHGLLTDASFFAREGTFPYWLSLGGIFIDAFGLALNKAVTETREAMYVVSVRGCVLLFIGARCKRWKGYFPHRFARRHGLDLGCCVTISFSKKYGKKGHCMILRLLVQVARSGLTWICAWLGRLVSFSLSGVGSPAPAKTKGVPLKEREDKERERKRKRGRESFPLSSSWDRERRSSREDLPSMAVSAMLSHARRARSRAHRALDSPPTTPSSFLVATSGPVDSWLG
ncbi:hypothetical protein AMTR_s00004p00270660 [Amborella trichopoda]|uniref:Uncharacterized protein n=1 Tax=Amborella trichopoda TaxID=13333 RepID=W1NEF3_AMBTC|nr:hypothetical protein AMTR_s00004p00270660 [Amborella trichopoda]